MANVEQGFRMGRFRDYGITSGHPDIILGSSILAPLPRPPRLVLGCPRAGFLYNSTSYSVKYYFLIYSTYLT